MWSYNNTNQGFPNSRIVAYMEVKMIVLAQRQTLSLGVCGNMDSEV